MSQRPEALATVAAELGAAHGVATRALPLDLAEPDAAEALHAAVAAAGLAPEVVVLDAGVFFFGEVADADLDRARRLLTLHVVTTSLLCTLFGRELRARRGGHLLIVSSISAYGDFPGIAYYGGSKKYLLGFARALRSELRPYGVNVTCLLPGATSTALYEGTAVPVARAERLGVMMSAKAVADAGLRAMFRRRAVAVPGALARLMVLFARLAPRFLIDLARRRTPWLPRP